MSTPTTPQTPTTTIKWAKLGEVCDIRNGYTPLKSRADFWTNGSIPWVKIEDMRAHGAQLFSAGNHVTPAAVKGKLLEPGTLLLSTTATIGVTSIVQIPCICNQQITAIWPKTDALDMNFLRYFISTQQRELMRLANQSGTVAILNNEGLRKLQIPLPALEKQREIAQKLDLFEALLRNLSTELSQRIKQQRYYSEQLLSPDNLDDFDWHTLGDVCEFQRGVTYKKTDELNDPGAKGLKVLRANNIDLASSALNLDDVKIIRSECKIKDSQRIYAGDILICIGSGSKEHVGKVCYFDEDLPNYVFGGFMGVVRAREGVCSKFIYYLLGSELFRAHLDKTLFSSTINNINNEMMKNFKIPLPALEKQRAIARVLDLFEALIANIRAELALRSKQARFYKEKLLDFS